MTWISSSLVLPRSPIRSSSTGRIEVRVAALKMLALVLEAERWVYPWPPTLIWSTPMAVCD